jgi:hypothetical protein
VHDWASALVINGQTQWASVEANAFQSVGREGCVHEEFMLVMTVGHVVHWVGIVDWVWAATARSIVRRVIGKFILWF